MKKKTGPKPLDLPYTNREYLIDQYYNKRKSLKVIADEIGCGETVVHKWFHRFELPIRTRSQALKGKKKSPQHIKNMRRRYKKWKAEGTFSGSNNPNWKGGTRDINQKDRTKLGRWRQIIIEKFLGITPKHLGAIPQDSIVANAIRTQKPFLVTKPESRASKAVKEICTTLLA